MSEAPRYLRNGRISLTRRLGEGGMAIVFEAYDHDLAVWRAVKFLKPDLAQRKSIRRRFIVEAQALAQLEHPNVVRVYDVGEEDGWPFLIMSLTRGGSLESYLARNGPMDPYLAVNAMIEVCSGIQAAHDVGIIHRDLKPDNVLITSQGVCRVTDFGIAMLGDEDHRKTRTGSVMGTLGFMAPEQHKDAKHLSPTADIFSLGATLYALLSEEPPNDLAMAAHHPKMLEHIPEVIRPVILGATAFVPNDRYDSAKTMARELQKVLDQLQPNPQVESLAHIVTRPMEIPTRTVPSDIDSHVSKLSKPSKPSKPSGSKEDALDLDRPTIPKALPYVMPSPKLSPSEGEPSYLDPEEEAKAKRKAEALARIKALQAAGRTQGASSHKQVPKTFVSPVEAPTPAPVPEANKPPPRPAPKAEVEEKASPKPTPVEQPRESKTSPVAENEEDVNKVVIKADLAGTVSEGFQQLIEILITFFIKPLKPMILPIIALAILTVGLIIWGATTVNGVAQGVYDQRDELYASIEAQREVIEDLRAIAGEAPLHEDRLKRMRKSKEPQKTELAFEYIDKIIEDLQRKQVSPPPGTAHRVDLAHEKLQVLISARREYELEYDKWKEASENGLGSVACRLHVGDCP